MNFFDSSKLFLNNLDFNNMTYLYRHNNDLVNSLANYSFSQNNTEKMYRFFPEMQDTFTNFEMLFHNIKDDSVLDYIKTMPDGKLYYPEPFIASPSFLHEEI